MIQINIIRIVWQAVRRITNEILGMKGLIWGQICATRYSRTNIAAFPVTAAKPDL